MYVCLLSLLILKSHENFPNLGRGLWVARTVEMLGRVQTSGKEGYGKPRKVPACPLTRELRCKRRRPAQQRAAEACGPWSLCGLEARLEQGEGLFFVPLASMCLLGWLASRSGKDKCQYLPSVLSNCFTVLMLRNKVYFSIQNHISTVSQNHTYLPMCVDCDLPYPFPLPTPNFLFFPPQVTSQTGFTAFMGWLPALGRASAPAEGAPAIEGAV